MKGTAYMIHYDLISFDMDGTLLDSNLKISTQSIDAINHASALGKTVVLSTGRSPSELVDYRKELKNVRFFICESGALILDTLKNNIIFSELIPSPVIHQILTIASDRNAMFYIISNGQTMVSSSYVKRIKDFHMERFEDFFNRTCLLKNDIVSDYMQNNFPIEKFNIFFATPELREHFVQALSHLPLEMARAEETSLELSPKNVSKGSGLLKLCGYLSIPVEHTIAVGDSDNDIEILKTAGLSVAMGNARPHIKELSDVIVADNDHGGCAEAIYKYLLNE